MNRLPKAECSRDCETLMRESNDEPKGKHSESDRHRRHDCDDDDDFLVTAFGPVVGQMCFYAVTAPYWHHDVGGTQINGLVSGLRLWY
jgi:hypothetical protein